MSLSRQISLRYEGKDARACLAVVQNSWLHRDEIKSARDMAVMGTDEECEAYLGQLERDVNHALEMWRFSQ